MNKVNVFYVDQFYSDIVLLGDSAPAKVHCCELSLPFALAAEVKTPKLFAGELTHIILKSDSGYGFSPNLVCISGDTIITPVLISEGILAIPVKKSAGTHSFVLTDGVSNLGFSVEFVGVLDSVDTFSFIDKYYFPFFGGLTRKVVLEVDSSFQIHKITANGIPVGDLSFLDSHYVLFSCSFPLNGSYGIVLYDDEDNILHSFSVTVALEQQIDVGVVGTFFEDFMYVYLLSGQYPAGGVFVIDHGDFLIKPVSNLETLPDKMALSESDRFVFVVRDRAGGVVPLTGYTITSQGFSLSGFTDHNGVISLSWYQLPKVFDLSFSSYDLTYLNCTLSNKGK